MEERFKAFLESEFRTIAPTKAAMEYRVRLYKDMKARAQELRIKGMTDEELIVETVLEDYEDIKERLAEFEDKEIKVNSLKRNAVFGAVVSVIAILLLTLTYVLVGTLSHVWHPTWLIMVGGVFLGIGVLLAFLGYKVIRKKKFLLLRLIVAVAEVLLVVFVFLLLQIVFRLNGSWLAFLAMVVMISGVDTAIAFFTDSKGKWVELPVFSEIFSVMLYVMLGILLTGFWHPGWIMCLVGVIVALSELAVFLALRNRNKNRTERNKHYEKYVKTDEKYWTDWGE